MQLELALPPVMWTMLVPYVGEVVSSHSRVVSGVRVRDVVDVERDHPDDVVGAAAAARR